MKESKTLFCLEKELNIILNDQYQTKLLITKGLDFSNYFIENIINDKRISKDSIKKINALYQIINHFNKMPIILNNAALIYEKYQHLKAYEQEHFYVLYLNHRKALIKAKCLFIGTINMSVVHPREVFKYAYLCSASFIICIHNHPTGNIEPSIEDINLTKKLNEIGKIHSILLLDHIIIGNGYYSFFENHML